MSDDVMHGNLRQDNLVRRSEINALKPLPYTFARHSFACFSFLKHFLEIVHHCPILFYVDLYCLIVVKSQDCWWKKRLASQARRSRVFTYRSGETSKAR